MRVTRGPNGLMREPTYEEERRRAQADELKYACTEAMDEPRPLILIGKEPEGEEYIDNLIQLGWLTKGMP